LLGLQNRVRAGVICLFVRPLPRRAVNVVELFFDSPKSGLFDGYLFFIKRQA